MGAQCVVGLKGGGAGVNLREFEAGQNLRIAIENLRENFSTLLELYALTAKAKRAFFDSCVAEGFSKEEALALTRDFRPFGV